MTFREKSDICNKLKNIRQKKGLTQRQVAQMSGMTIKSYADFERDSSNIRIDNFVKICNVLDVMPNELLLEEYDDTEKYRDTLNYVKNLCESAVKEGALVFDNKYINQ